MAGQAPSWLPPLNTALIAISGAFLLLGYFFIRRREITQHRRSMLTATVFAALFLAVYVARALLFEAKHFTGQDWVRVFYLAILGSHTVVATLVGPLALYTLYRAFRGQFDQHRRIARLALPLWLYAALTGWAVYAMLYWL